MLVRLVMLNHFRFSGILRDNVWLLKVFNIKVTTLASHSVSVLGCSKGWSLSVLGVSEGVQDRHREAEWDLYAQLTSLL